MRNRTAFFYTLTDTRWSAALFVFALLAVYAVLPVFVDYFLLPNQYFVELAQLASMGCVAVCLGYLLPLFDHRFKKSAPRIAIDSQAFHAVVWVTFLMFLVITFATADAVPIVSALKGGATSAELSQERGEFLKGRAGVEVALSYLGTFYFSALLPYSLVMLFIERSRVRYLLLMLLLVFSMSFLVKSLFIYVLLPLFYLAAQRNRSSSFLSLSIVIVSLGLLYLMAVLAIEFDADTVVGSGSEFFEATYASRVSGGAIDFLIWRSVAVPMFTASDTLLVFHEQLGGQPLWGATSSFLAWVFSLDRVNLERLVFAQQFGWNDLANANSVFFTEAFANFGWSGVAVFSMFVGQSLRWFRRSHDEAFKALWIIYCFALFSGGLIGMLLSNGYFCVFLFALFFKLKRRSSLHVARRIGGSVSSQKLLTFVGPG